MKTTKCKKNALGMGSSKHKNTEMRKNSLHWQGTEKRLVWVR